MLKTAIQTNVWSDEIHRTKFHQMLSEIAAIGYQGFEIGAHRVDLGAPDEFRQQTALYGLQVAGIHTHGELFNPQSMEESYPRIEKAISFAAAVGSPFVLISGKPKFGKSAAEQQQEAGTLTRVGQMCQQHGIALCYHNHYWEIEHNLRELHFLCDHTDPELVGLALDVGWVHRAGRAPAEVTRLFLNRIRYFHFKDFRVKDFLHDTWTELGDGYVDLPGVLEVIGEKGEFWLTVERDEALPDAAESARLSHDYLVKLIGEHASR